MQRTVRLKLNPDSEQAGHLLDTLHQHTACFNAVAAHGWQHSEKNGVRLLNPTYHDLRERFPDLPAQLVIAARVRATEAVKSALARKKKGRKVSRPAAALTPIRYDARTYTVKHGTSTVSLASVAGRGDLIFRKGRFWLHVVVTLSDVEFHPLGAVVGVDLGLNRPAVVSNNRFFGSQRWREVDRRYFRLKRALQAKGTRSAKKRLHKLAGKVNRFRRDCDHAPRRRIVESVQPGAVIVVENLVDIRARTKQRGRESRRRMHSWSFAQLRAFRCGHVNHSNRRSQSRFVCRACGFELNADLNAARNIARKYLASGGMTAAGGPLSTGLSCQPAQAG